MAEEPLVTMQTANGVATIRLNRPGKRNALSTELLATLREILRGIAEDFPATRAVVLLGEGPSFCAGADIKEFERWDAASLFEFIELGSEVFRTIHELPQPVIAGIQGHALGGGLELALACDLRLANQTATFGLPEINIGGVPGWGGTVRLQEVIGRGMATYMTLTGEFIDAITARSLGLVHEVVGDDLAGHCAALAARLADKIPTTLRLAKRALNSGSPYDVSAQAGIEQYSNLACMLTDERRDSVESFVGRV